MRFIVTCCSILGTATLALAGDLRVPQDFATIQAAVDASADGDLILVGPGVYAESVTAVKSNITLRGHGAVWDGGTDGSAGPCLDLQGDGNAVAGFTFENGTDQVVMNGDGASVSHCTSLHASGSFCVLTGSGDQVQSCWVSGPGGPGVVIDGSGSTVLRVRVSSPAGTGIEVTGDGSAVTGCRVAGGLDGGIQVSGDGCTVSGDHVMSTATFGISLQGNASTVSHDVVIHCGSTGGAGFEVTGSDNTVGADLAVDCSSDGFSLQGDGNACTHDNATNCADDGFDIQGGIGVSLSGCLAANNGQEGVENGGTGTVVQRCRLVANQTDLALDGSVGASYDQVLHSTFQTGSALTVVVGD